MRLVVAPESRFALQNQFGFDPAGGTIENTPTSGVFSMVNSWGETWKTFEDIDRQLVELGIDEIMGSRDV